MKPVNNVLYGTLITKANKLGVKGYKRDGVTTILKNNKVIQRISTEVKNEGLTKSTLIEHFKDNVGSGTTAIIKNLNKDGTVENAFIITYKGDEPLKAMVSVADENHRLQTFKEVDPYQLMIACIKAGLD